MNLGYHEYNFQHSNVYLVGYPDYFKLNLPPSKIDSVKPVLSIKPFTVFD